MNTTDITIHVEPEDILRTMQQCHFREEDFASLQALSRAMAPLLRAKAYYVWEKRDEKVSYDDYAVVFLTLGNGVDALQELYLDRNCLTEAYMVECIALGLLEKAYREFIKEVQRETGKWAQKIDFLGDTYPIELLPRLYREFGQMDISYNEKMVLSPQKSVVFLLPMSSGKKGDACNICENCSNKGCVLRSAAD